jgi:carbon-monoxide dehydrogenase medium subunit
VLLKSKGIKSMKNFDYFSPCTLQEGLSLLDNYQQKAKVLAGGTDLVAQMRAGRIQPTVIIDIKRIPELNRLEWSADKTLHIGAAVPISTVVGFPSLVQRFSMLHQGCSLIGSTRIRNRATIGGNICNAAPSADSAPPLLCLGARAVLANCTGTRTVPLESIFRGPGKISLAPNELLLEIEIPAPPNHSAGCYLRHTPREEMDIAVVGVAAFLVLSPRSKVCQEARIALGAVAPTPIRVPQAEALLAGKSLNEEDIEKVAKQVAEAASPISDIRSSAEYRKELLKVLTRRALNGACESLNIQI